MNGTQVLFLVQSSKNLNFFVNTQKNLLRLSSVSAIIMMCFYILAASRKTRSVDMKISYKKLWVLLMIDHSQNARDAPFPN